MVKLTEKIAQDNGMDKTVVAKQIDEHENQEAASQDWLDALATPGYSRLQIPLRDRYAMRHIAEILTGLSVRLAALSSHRELNDYEAIRLAYSAIQSANHACGQFLQKSRTPKM